MYDDGHRGRGVDLHIELRAYGGPHVHGHVHDRNDGHGHDGCLVHDHGGGRGHDCDGGHVRDRDGGHSRDRDGGHARDRSGGRGHDHDRAHDVHDCLHARRRKYKRSWCGDGV